MRLTKERPGCGNFSVINIKVTPQVLETAVEKLQEKMPKGSLRKLDDDPRRRGAAFLFGLQYPPEARKTAETEHIPQTKIGFIQMPEFCAAPIFVYTKISDSLKQASQRYVTLHVETCRRGKFLPPFASPPAGPLFFAPLTNRISSHVAFHFCFSRQRTFATYEATYWKDKKIRGNGKNNLQRRKTAVH